MTASRLRELYNLARFAKKPEPTPKIMPFFLKTDELYVYFRFDTSIHKKNSFRIAKTVGLNDNKIRFDLSPDDLHCLNEGEFLNDNIIDFYLQ